MGPSSGDAYMLRRPISQHQVFECVAPEHCDMKVSELLEVHMRIQACKPTKVII